MEKLHKIIDVKTAKFLIVGLLNTLIGSGIMFTLYNVFNVSYWLSSASNYIFGSIVSYILNKYWTFQNKEKEQKTIPLFILNIIVCYSLAYGIARPVISSILSGASKSIQENISMGVGLVLFTGFNYLGQRYFVFKERATKLSE